MMKTGRIFLYGAPGSGKTTIGKRLSEALRCGFADLDEEIVRRGGRTIPEIFAADGEAGFRAEESRVLAEVISDNPAKVIALGGGTLLDGENRRWCEEAGTVICLETPDEEELARRLGNDGTERPLGDKSRERSEHYASFTNRIVASFDLPDSLVVVGRSIAFAFLAGEHVVVDANVDRLHSRRLGLGELGNLSEKQSFYTVLPSGEEHKHIHTVEGLWSAFAAAGLGRKDRIVAVGGGVTGDLIGFAAATWMRGIDWINVPTTLLAMIDASVGGKTGCDTEEGKNLVGAFHPPRLVVIDTDFLSTLPENEIANGRAEMVKHEIVGGMGRNEELRMKNEELRGLEGEIAGNLAVKVKIVREDPLERNGRRALLNCGHTIAHAIERASGYRIAHGKAVAIGCVEEAKLAVRQGLAPEGWPEELAARFREFGLRTEMPETMDFDSLLEYMRMDKKNADGRIGFALPCGWGKVIRWWR